MKFTAVKRPHPNEGYHITDDIPATAGRYLHCRVFAFEKYQRADGVWMERMLDADEQLECDANKIASALSQ